MAPNIVGLELISQNTERDVLCKYGSPLLYETAFIRAGSLPEWWKYWNIDDNFILESVECWYEPERATMPEPMPEPVLGPVLEPVPEPILPTPMPTPTALTPAPILSGDIITTIFVTGPTTPLPLPLPPPTQPEPVAP